MIYLIIFEYKDSPMIHFRHFVDVSKLGIFCNRETRNVTIFNKKLKTGLCPKTSKSLKLRYVPKLFSLLIKA